MVVYIAISAFGIILINKFVSKFIGSNNIVTNIQIIAEWMYILLPGILFYRLISNSVKEEYVSKKKLLESYRKLSKTYRELKETEEKIYHLAFFDNLTGLPNRMKFDEILSREITKYAEANQKFAVLYLDLDNFKTVNDTLGHDFGDLLLKNAAIKLKQCIRSVDTVARLGGDEFAVLLPGPIDVSCTLHIVKSIISSFQDPWVLENRIFHVTPSIGISFFPANGITRTNLLKNADAAMYFAKKSGKNKYYFYNNMINKNMIEKLDLENALRKALPNNEFIIYYQPQIDIFTGKIVGVEALLRWNHPS